MSISQELGDVLIVLADAIRSEDPFTEIKCLRKLDQNRVTVSTWTFNDVATVLNFSYDLIGSIDDANTAFASKVPNIQVHVDRWEDFRATGLGQIIENIKNVIRGDYAPGGPNSLYWDGWDKETHKTIVNAVQSSDTHDLAETIKLYELLQQDPVALNRWIGFGLGLIQGMPVVPPPSEDE